MARGWVYLMAILDWFSRYVVAWELSITLEADFCVTTLQRALTLGRPEIFNTDQGSQFTSDGWIETLQGAQVAISMDGRGRVFDNIFIERLWRSAKMEEVYLHDYQTVKDVRDGLGWYFPFYNGERPHQALNDCTPSQTQALPSAAARYPTLRLRVLVAVTTGLRHSDIEAIHIGDIHFDRNTLTTRNRKAGKAMAERPIPEQVMTELSNHVAALPDGQEKLFHDKFSPKK